MIPVTSSVQESASKKATASCDAMNPVENKSSRHEFRERRVPQGRSIWSQSSAAACTGSAPETQAAFVSLPVTQTATSQEAMYPVYMSPSFQQGEWSMLAGECSVGEQQ